MADVVYTDTPNDPLHPLVLGPLEPIGFTATKALSYLAVVQGELVEVAYMDGAFTPRYAAQSSISGDLKTATVLRSGGWLEPPLFRPRFAAAVASGGQAMGAIYEIDLTAQASQSMLTAGSYTIDGKTWWAKGSLGGAGARSELINGSGLRLYWPDAASGNTDGSNWRGAVTTNARVLTLPLAQLADYNPLAPLAIVWRMTGKSLASTNDFSCPYAGVIDAAESAASLTAPEKLSAMTLSRIGTTNAWWTGLNNNDTRNPGGNAAATPALGSHVSGVHRFLASRWYPLLGPYTGALTVPDDYVSEITLTGDMVMLTHCSSTPSFIFCAEHWFSGQGDLDTYLTHLKILQPKVTP